MSQSASVAAAPPTSHANGVLTAPTGRSAVGGNKKKAKRRAKAAAKATEQQYDLPAPPPLNGPSASQVQYPPDQYYDPRTAQYENQQYPDQYDEQYDYSSEDDDEPIAYDSHYRHVPNGGAYPNQVPLAPATSRKKNKRSGQLDMRFTESETAAVLNSAMSQLQLPNPPRHNTKGVKQDRIWNTSTQEERERIKEFWLSLSEDERKGLLKIEKNAVLSKMKEQQKHSCSCTVCGRKRTAIEEELEVLYDAYYEELAQYANQQPGEAGERLLEHNRPPLNYPQQHPVHAPRPLNTQPQHRTSRVHEIIDEGEDVYSDDEESYSEEDDELYSDDEDYEDDYPHGAGQGFFDFGNNLTVKGGSFITDMLTHLHGRLNNLPDGILTVADDLLKNDGRKFIEMMEQLAERRMQREREVEHTAYRPAHNHPNGEPPLDDEEYDEEDDYDSADEYDDEGEESDMGGLTDEQRMEEGRRMFQIFAARMFEQRVLTAYREKVAAERQAKLLEELEEEDKAKTQKDAKKAKEAEKKKKKKQAQQQAKAEERAKKEAEKAAEEAAAKAAEEKKLEEQRKRKEEQRRKKEAEKKAQDEERLRKEAERLKRQQEERDRKAEEERKAREQKAQEKKVKDEQRKKEREEREAKEKEAREQRAHDEKMRKEQEARLGEKKPQAPHIVKRPSQMGQVAVPPALTQQKSVASLPSPHVAVATPAIPKAPGSGQQQQRQPSGPKSSTTSPKAAAPTASKAKSPSIQESQPQSAPKQILQNPHKQQPRPAVSLPHPSAHQGPPPGVHPPYQQSGYGNMGFPPFSGQHPHAQSRGLPHQPPQGPPFRQFPPGGPMPGQNSFGAVAPGRPFTGEAPPGFQHQLPNHTAPAATPAMSNARTIGPSHSRQHSANDLDMSPPAHAQPIARPAPIQRPSSVKPSGGDHHSNDDLADLSKHLGSRALLDDADDPLPSANELRRTSNPIGAPPRTNPLGFASPHFGGPPSNRIDAFTAPGSNWSTPSTFGPSSGLNTPSWGNPSLPTAGTSWSNTTSFSSLGGPRPGNPNRPRAVRLAICAACRSLGPDYHDVSRILTAIAGQGSLDSQPSLQEIEDICETEGDAANGGGLLHFRKSGPLAAVKFDAGDGIGGAPVGGRSGLGDIGSPVVGSALPGGGGGFGRGFGGIGGLASPGGF